MKQRLFTQVEGSPHGSSPAGSAGQPAAASRRRFCADFLAALCPENGRANLNLILKRLGSAAAMRQGRAPRQAPRPRRVFGRGGALNPGFRPGAAPRIRVARRVGPRPASRGRRRACWGYGTREGMETLRVAKRGWPRPESGFRPRAIQRGWPRGRCPSPSASSGGATPAPGSSAATSSPSPRPTTRHTITPLYIYIYIYIYI